MPPHLPPHWLVQQYWPLLVSVPVQVGLPLLLPELLPLLLPELLPLLLPELLPLLLPELLPLPLPVREQVVKGLLGQETKLWLLFLMPLAWPLLLGSVSTV